MPDESEAEASRDSGHPCPEYEINAKIFIFCLKICMTMNHKPNMASEMIPQ